MMCQLITDCLGGYGYSGTSKDGTGFYTSLVNTDKLSGIHFTRTPKKVKGGNKKCKQTKSEIERGL